MSPVWDGHNGSALSTTCFRVPCFNPVRAGVAEALEASDFTSGQDRIVARQAGKKLKRLKNEKKRSEKKGEMPPEQAEWIEAAKRELTRDDWLSSFGRSVASGPNTFRNMELDEYLELLEWTGRQVSEGKRGKIPGHLAHILERLEIGADELQESDARARVMR